MVSHQSTVLIWNAAGYYLWLCSVHCVITDFGSIVSVLQITNVESTHWMNKCSLKKDLELVDMKANIRLYISFLKKNIA